MYPVRKTLNKAQNGAAYWLLMMAAMTMMVLAVPQAMADNPDHPPSIIKARVQLAAQKAATHFATLQGTRYQSQGQTDAKLIRVNANGRMSSQR